MSEVLRSDPSGDQTQLSNAAGMTRRVISGSLWSVAGQCAVLLASFVATPFVLRLLGAEAYGLLALINLVIGYLAFTDFGMGVASTRFAAGAFDSKSDREEVAVVWTALLIAAVPALLGAILLSLIAKPLVEQVLRLPPYLHEQAIVAFRLSAAGFVARILSGVVNTPQLVRLRLDTFTLISAGTAVLQICMIPVVLTRGGGLVGAVAVIVLFSVTALVLNAVVSHRLLPALGQPQIKTTLVKPLLRFGSAVIVSSVVGTILLTAEKLLLPRFASMTALAHYSVAYTLANLLLVMPAAMNQSLIPAFSRLQGTNRTALAHLYGRALRGNLLWLMPAAVLLIAGAQPFIKLWAGPTYTDAVKPFYILVMEST